MDILLILGIVLLSGFGGGTLLKKIKVPQVVGYILLGVVIGVSGFHILKTSTIDSLSPLNSLALGLIGFMIGSELRLNALRKLGRYILAILLAEALGAYLLVSVTTYLLTGKSYLAILLGALSSATAPAATVDVIWEYRAKGVLTTSILAIVGLDDALALIVYGFSAAIAKVVLFHSNLSVVRIIGMPCLEIAEAVGTGVALAIVLGYLLRKFRADNQRLIITLGVVLVSTGIAKTLHFSPILSCMFIGLVLANLCPNVATSAYHVLERFVPPIYVMFFVLVGSRLDVRLLASVGLLGLVYVTARSAGKIFGARFGATVSRAPSVLRKYLGLALFSQAGVAIGLAMSVYEEFSHLGPEGQNLGLLIINVITATTFIVQIIGPPFVKYALARAGEIEST